MLMLKNYIVIVMIQDRFGYELSNQSLRQRNSTQAVIASESVAPSFFSKIGRRIRVHG